MKNTDFNRHVAKAHLAAAGWDIQLSGESNPFSCHAFYLIDFHRNICQVVALPIDAVNALKSDVPIPELVSSVEHFLGLVAADPANMDASNSLGFSVAAYIKHTQTYRAWASQAGGDERGHFFINLYGCSPRVTLRPFAIRPPGGVLIIDRNQVMRDATDLRDFDLRKNPDMF